MSTSRFDCRAVLFDLDGVLADSTALVDEVWRAWAHEKGLDGDTVMKVSHGRRAEEVVRSLAPHLSAPDEVTRIEEREIAEISRVAAIAGADALLRSLPSGSWAVVTSGTTPLATGRLRALGFPFPDVLITADDVAEGKPHPEGYLAAALRLGAEAADCIVIEDAPPGIEAARTGGMTPIGVTTTYEPAALAAADTIVASLEQIRVIRVQGDGRELPLISLTVEGSKS